MLIGERIREIREAKGLSQGDVEKRSGLLRVYISRVENDHLVPSSKRLRKLPAGWRFLSISCFTKEKRGRMSPVKPASRGERIVTG